MNAQTFDNDYPDIAINTVARYAGVGVLDVLSALSQKIGSRQSQSLRTLNSFQVKHRRALRTVAKYSGIDLETVTQRLDHSEQPVSQGEFRQVDKAA